jgi:putative thioredoxin
MTQPRSFSLHGAVDLGARQVAEQRRQQAGTGDGAQDGASGAIIDVTDETFNDEVVLRSREVPVVLDLWAEWCGPCKQLGPILEKLAIEANGSWVLAKIDVDANPQIGAALQVQSIPMVVAVIGGQVVDGFTGAQPEHLVKAWLGQVVQVAAQLGLRQGAVPGADGEAGPDAAQQAMPPGVLPVGPDTFGSEALADEAFGQAQDAMDRGDLDAATAAFEKVLAASPGDQAATSGLQQVDLIRRVTSYDQATARRAADERPDDADAQARVADIDLAMGKIEASFDRLLDLIGRTSGEPRDQARVHLLGLFEIFPPKDPRVTKARARLSSLLF